MEDKQDYDTVDQKQHQHQQQKQQQQLLIKHHPILQELYQQQQESESHRSIPIIDNNNPDNNKNENKQSEPIYQQKQQEQHNNSTDDQRIDNIPIEEVDTNNPIPYHSRCESTESTVSSSAVSTISSDHSLYEELTVFTLIRSVSASNPTEKRLIQSELNRAYKYTAEQYYEDLESISIGENTDNTVNNNTIDPPNLANEYPYQAQSIFSLPIHLAKIINNNPSNNTNNTTIPHQLSIKAQLNLHNTALRYTAEFREWLRLQIIDTELTERLESEYIINCHQLFPNSSNLSVIRTDGDGNCLCHSCCISVFGIHDHKYTIRQSALLIAHSTLESLFRQRFINNSIIELGLTTDIDTIQALNKEFNTIIERLDDNKLYLEPIHIFILAHLFRRPIIVYSAPFIQPIIDNQQQSINDSIQLQSNTVFGIYLPLLFEEFRNTLSVKSISHCCDNISTDPIVLCYYSDSSQNGQGHFAALLCTDGELPIPALLPLHYLNRFNNTINRLPIRFLDNNSYSNELRQYQLLDYYFDLQSIWNGQLYARLHLKHYTSEQYRINDRTPIQYKLWSNYIKQAAIVYDYKHSNINSDIEQQQQQNIDKSTSHNTTEHNSRSITPTEIPIQSQSEPQSASNCQDQTNPITPIQAETETSTAHSDQSDSDSNSNTSHCGSDNRINPDTDSDPIEPDSDTIIETSPSSLSIGSDIDSNSPKSNIDIQINPVTINTDKINRI